MIFEAETQTDLAAYAPVIANFPAQMNAFQNLLQKINSNFRITLKAFITTNQIRTSSKYEMTKLIAFLLFIYIILNTVCAYLM